MASSAPHLLPPDPVPPPGWHELERFRFGDSPALADALVALVRDGPKRASCWPVKEGQQTFVGKRMVATDGSAVPRAVIETTELFQCAFDRVDAAFAFDEGEGDRSLANWRRDHMACFGRAGVFAPAMLLWCERFRLVARL